MPGTGRGGDDPGPRRPRSTYGGNPLACAAALAVLETIEEEHLVANAHAMGAYFVHRLNEAPFRDKIADLRAVGLMMAWNWPPPTPSAS